MQKYLHREDLGCSFVYELQKFDSLGSSPKNNHCCAHLTERCQSASSDDCSSYKFRDNRQESERVLHGISHSKIEHIDFSFGKIKHR